MAKKEVPPDKPARSKPGDDLPRGRIKTLAKRRETGKSSAGGRRGPPSPSPRYELPGTDEKPTGPDKSWRIIGDARWTAFDQAVPAYLLDKNYFFLDWNPAFDLLVAQPLGLRRIHSHAEDFVRSLKNVRDVYERSKRVFAPGRTPLLDFEPLVYESQEFGEIEFQKIAVQITDNEAVLAAWSVFLNVSRADRAKELWAAVHRRIRDELHWARYAVSYDALLVKFEEYGELVRSVVSRLDNCHRVLDLGAGTGNGTIELLEKRRDREVWAVESNHAMLSRLIDKLGCAEQAAHRDYFSHLKVIKDSIIGLEEHAAIPLNYFDGAVLINVLYALDDPERCLRGLHQLLRPGGRLVLSTPHTKTDVDKLFEQMRSRLTELGVFQELRSNYEDGYRRNLEMLDRIHRDSREDIEHYLRNSGFRIVEWQDSAYVGAVVIVTAVKD